ncbi:VOC family protein [Pararoseomonas sp. SCSIO 73927]|uniref:bleomycin resistance protein n=1 Tax=Pararoseomonas sp. SCSIO 73927 TaxID=3114537 RepID=UPI0030CB8355
MTDRIADPAARAAAEGSGQVPEGGFAALVPELSVTEIAASLRFWCGPLGFRVAYDRPAARFAFLTHGPARGAAQLMLCERNGRWGTGGMQRPFGRGINLQITVERVAPILEGLEAAGWPLFEAPREAWYRTGDGMAGQREFLVQDPDGYLLRFAERLEGRPALAE